MTAFQEPRTYPFALDGGLDLISSQLTLKPGQLIAGSNVEQVGGKSGYLRAGGYERCSDDRLPSDVKVYLFRITTPAGEINENDLFYSGDKSIRPLETLDSPTSGDTVVVASNDSSFSSGDMFVCGESSFVLAEQIDDMSSIGNDGLQEYRRVAIEQTRSNIPQVPGYVDGKLIDGGFRLRGKNYVFYDGKLYRGDDYAWTEMPMPFILPFKEGTVLPSVGDIIGTAAGAYGTIKSITHQEGVWDSESPVEDQSQGYFTVDSISGSFPADSEIFTYEPPSITGGIYQTETFDTLDGWSLLTEGFFHSGSAVVCDGSQQDTPLLTKAHSGSVGVDTHITVTTSGITAGTVRVEFDDTNGIDITEDGTHTVTVTSTDTIRIEAGIDFVGKVEEIVLSDEQATGGQTVGLSFAKASADGYIYEITPGGRHETKEHNYTNLANNWSIYGVSGVCDAYEFDGESYIPIIVPGTDKYPHNINIHQERLQLFFPGGEWLYSVSGQPRVFNPLLGSGSYSTGSEIVGAKTIHGNAEVVFCKNSTWLLVGDGIYQDATATRNWQFFEHDEDIGAEEYSIAAHGMHVFMSNAELRAFGSTDTSALYTSYSISEEIRPLLENSNRKPIAAIWVKSKSQYRLFFDDGQGICIPFYRGRPKGATTFKFPDGIANAWRNYENGVEYLFFVSNTGYLYRMDSGNTHDEHAIEGSFRLPFYHYGSPDNDKQFPVMTLELDAPILITDDTEITYTVNHNYGSLDSPLPIPTTLTDVEGAGGLYGSNDGYGNFVWSGAIVSEIFAYLDGYGANMSILVSFKTKYDSPFRFLTALVEYILLGKRRK